MTEISDEILDALDNILCEKGTDDVEIDDAVRESLALQETDFTFETEKSKSDMDMIAEEKQIDWSMSRIKTRENNRTKRSNPVELDGQSPCYLSEGYESSIASTPTVMVRQSEGGDGYNDFMELDNGHNETIKIDHRLRESLSVRFARDDLKLFDRDLGRDEFIDELGRSFMNGSSSKSLAWYRMSCYGRVSDNFTKIREGWMLKRGSFVPSWRKRWFTLHRTPKGPLLTYSRDKTEHTLTKTIDLSSTSRCTIPAPTKYSKEHEFKIITLAGSDAKEFTLSATSAYEMNEWVYALQALINLGTRITFGGISGFEKLWNDIGIRGFILRYGIRRLTRANHMQVRLLELNFAEQIITNFRRGEAMNSFPFSDLESITLHSNKGKAQEFGMLISFKDHTRPWPVFLDTVEARDDLYAILYKIKRHDIAASDLMTRCPRLKLKKAYMERKHVDSRFVGSCLSFRGRMYVILYECCIAFYPEQHDVDDPPWYVLLLMGLQISCKEEKGIIVFGRFGFSCANAIQCRQWYDAAKAAVALPKPITDTEIQTRMAIKSAFHSTVARLRKLLKAHVLPESNGPPKDAATVEMMIQTLWSAVFPQHPYTSNSDEQWKEVGFQRGGPASDLRSSGLLGLHCIIYFAKYHEGPFHRILERTRFGISSGNMKNYPLAIACINAVSILTRTLGFGDSGSLTEGTSINALKTFIYLISSTVSPMHAMDEDQIFKPLSSLKSWEEIENESNNKVFEEIFCILFPILDAIFVEMGAGYMEFGQVIDAFQKRVVAIFDRLPLSLKELQIAASEPCTDTLNMIESVC